MIENILIENIPHYEIMLLIMKICGYILLVISVGILFYLPFDKNKIMQKERQIRSSEQ